MQLKEKNACGKCKKIIQIKKEMLYMQKTKR